MMTSTLPSRSRPWGLGSVLGLYFAVSVGALLLVLGWWGASGASEPSQQTLWIDLAVIGILLSGVGIGGWLLTGQRAVGKRRRVIILALMGGDGPEPRIFDPMASSLDDLVAAPAMTRYHRTSCLLAAGKPVRVATLAAHRSAGRRPCGICQP